MVPEISLYLPNIPGQFSRVLTALASAEVNIRGFSVDLGGATSQLRLLFQDGTEAERAVKALHRVPYETVERRLLLLSAPDEPGMLLKVADTMREQGINVEYGYVTLGQTEDGEVFFALKVDAEKAQLAIEHLKQRGIEDHDRIPVTIRRK
jgi:hypothetical protein